MEYPSTTSHRSRRLLHGIIVLALLALAVDLHAQVETVGNDYVKASVVSDTASNSGGGRFYIGSGPFYGDYIFLYRITSNVVFRVTSASDTSYFTNAKDAFSGQPSISGVPVNYRSFDLFHESNDTIAVIWRNLAGVDVTMRFIAERPRTAFDRGSDVLIEFSYEPSPGAQPAELGILMMLDAYNGQAAGTVGGSGDKISILTSKGYFATTLPGKLFVAGRDEMPEFYHAGNFLYSSPLNNVLPVHRLSGVSHNGRPLTPPELLAIGDWHVLRYIGWDVDESAITGRPVSDAATITRWSGLQGSGTVRTAFGMDDKPANDLFHCRDSALFIDIKTLRQVGTRNDANAYVEKKFDLETWVTNTGTTAQNVTITLVDPIGEPNVPGRLLLDSASASQALALNVGETKKVTWRLKTSPAFDDSAIDVPLDIRLSYDSPSSRDLRLPCTPTITVFEHDPLASVDRSAPESSRGAENALAILDLRPQPAVAGGDLELTIRNTRGSALKGELIAIDGTIAARFSIEAASGGEARARVPLPASLPPGMYIVRLDAPGASAGARLIVIDR